MPNLCGEAARRPCQPPSRMLAAGLAFSLLFAACSQEAVDYVSLDNLPRFHLTEILSLGDGTDPNGVFFGDIEDLVAVDRAGRILVGDSQEYGIYVFSASGEMLAKIGSEGEGPGEFSSIGAIRIGPADTLFAFDYYPDRITAFEPGSYRYAYDFTVADDSAGNGPGEFIGAVPSGFLFTFDDPFDPGADQPDRILRARLVDWKGRIVDGLEVQLAAPKRMHVPLGNSVSLFSRVPFNRTPVFRRGPDGLLYSGTTDSISIAISAADGSLQGNISVRLEPAPVTGDDIRAYMERYEADEVDPVRSHPLFDVHKTKPAYSTFVVDDIRRVWLQMPQGDADSTSVRWILVDSDSRPIGDAMLPASATLEAVTGGRAYTVHDADVQTLVVYEITEP